MARFALVTAIYGGYDKLKDPARQDGDVDCVCFTDDPNLRSDVWRVVHWPKSTMPHFLAAKSFKTLPMRFVDAEASVWVDGSVEVRSPSFVVEAVAATPVGAVGTWPHPWNKTLWAEADEGGRQARYKGQRLAEQVAMFEADGMSPSTHPRHTAVVVRHHDERTERMGFEWHHQLDWSMSDQIGFAYAVWRAGLEHADLPRDQAFLRGFRTASRPDAWLAHHGHAATGMYNG